VLVLLLVFLTQRNDKDKNMMAKKTVNIDLVSSLYSQGKSQAEIGKLLGVSQSVISDRMRQANIKKRKDLPIVLSPLDAAYIAGILDGEGSFNIGKHYNKTKHCSKRGFNWEIRISVGMADTQALELIKRCYSKKTNLRMTKPKNKRHRTIYYITLYSGEIRKTIDQLIPYLRVKKPQAKLIKESVTIIKPKMDKVVDARLATIKSEISNLNNPNRSLYGKPAGEQGAHH